MTSATKFIDEPDVIRNEAIDNGLLAIDNRTTELRTIIKALDKLASAISWTRPNDSANVSIYLMEAFDAIGKLKEMVNDER